MPDSLTPARVAEQLPPEVLKDLSEVIRRELGIHLPEDRWSDLTRAISAYCKDRSEPCAMELANRLLASPPDVEQLRLLSLHLTIGETYFFRDESLYRALRDIILPPLLQRARTGLGPVSIWSAGCSTGEEPYSIGMLLEELGARLEDTSILATDLNDNSLQTARDGVYGAWSFRGCSPQVKSRYFHYYDNKYILTPPIRQRVSFQKLNLVKDQPPGVGADRKPFDIILCRNVLMYFERETAQQQVEKFYHYLAEGGWLALAASEVSHMQLDKFRPARFAGVLLHQKCSTLKAPAVKSPVASLPLPPSLSPTPIPEPPGRRLKPRQAPPVIAAPPAPRPPRPVDAPGQPQPVQEPEVHHLQALFEAADYSQVLQEASVLMDKDIAPETRSNCCKLAARAAANIGQIDAAVHWCRLAQKASPQNPSAYYLAGVLLQAGGLLDEAAAELRRALYLDPSHVGCQIAYAELRNFQGDIDISRKLLETAFSGLDKMPSGGLVPDMDGMTAGDVAGLVLQLLRSRAGKP